jgi:hypothetical protein
MKVVCYKDKLDNTIHIDYNSDLKEMRDWFGYDRYEILNEQFCKSKKAYIKFENKMKSKYKF